MESDKDYKAQTAKRGSRHFMRQKKAQSSMPQIENIVVGLVIVVMAVNLAPEMFLNIADLEDNANVPGWVSAVLYVVVGAGLTFTVYYVFLR